MRVSVVIPARDAEATLGATLDALAAQELAEPFEVLVVDDGSVDATPALVERHPVGARLVSGTGEGPGAARNVGVLASSGSVLAFTDADCVPAPGWLRAGLEALERTGAGIVQGAVAPVGPAGRFDRTLWVPSEYGVYETANLFLRREWFDRVGGFVDWVNRPWRPAGPPSGPQAHFGEDALLAWRAKRLGAVSAFAADARVGHAVFAGRARTHVAIRRRDGLFAELAVLIPELRERMFFGRIFLSRRSATFDLAAAGALAALAARRPAPALVGLPYVWLIGRETRRHGGRAHMAAALVAGDAVGAWSLLRTSLRARTLLL